MSPASSYNGFIFYIFLSKNRRQRIFFKKMPGSALFPDEPAPQTAAKKVPEGRSPPGTEKKKHTSAAAPAKKIGERRARLSYAFPNIGQTLALLPPMVLGLIAEGNAPLPGAERKAVGTRPSASGRRGGLFAPLPCLTPADGTGACFLDLLEASSDTSISDREFCVSKTHRDWTASLRSKLVGR